MAYSEKKIQKIVDTLIDGTKDGYIKWSLTKSVFNSDTRHNMIYKSDDGVTSFTISINLEDSLLSLTKVTNTLYINNDDLVDDSLQVSGYDYPDTKVLAQLIYDKFIKPKVIKNLPKKGVLDGILGKINKQHHREEQIDDILEDDTKPSLEKPTPPKTKIIKEGEKPPFHKEEKPKKKWWQF